MLLSLDQSINRPIGHRLRARRWISARVKNKVNSRHSPVPLLPHRPLLDCRPFYPRSCDSRAVPARAIDPFPRPCNSHHPPWQTHRLPRPPTTAPSVPIPTTPPPNQNQNQSSKTLPSVTSPPTNDSNSLPHHQNPPPLRRSTTPPRCSPPHADPRPSSTATSTRATSSATTPTQTPTSGVHTTSPPNHTPRPRPQNPSS